MRERRPLSDASGFTLVEVIVAILILSIGVLATVSLIDGANRTTGDTSHRVAATNVARDVVEAARSIPYQSLSAGSADSQIAATAGLEDASASTAGVQVVRRNITYTIKTDVCLVDDPADGVIATQPAGSCGAPTSGTGSDTDGPDYKRMKIDISWKDRATTRTLTQSTIISRNYSGSAIDPNYPAPNNFTLTNNAYTDNAYTGSSTSLQFKAQTTPPAQKVKWLLNGDTQSPDATASTPAGAFLFSWAIGTPTGSGTGCSATGGGTLDGTYFVGAAGFDGFGASAGPRSLTMTLNRCRPLAPTGAGGGYDFLFSDIELLWEPAPEQDVVGYYVYRSTTATPADWTALQVTSGTCGGLIKEPTCWETPQNARLTYYYRIAAVDRDSSGALAAGAMSPILTVDPNNKPPCWDFRGQCRDPSAPIAATTPLSVGTTSTLQWIQPDRDPNGNAIAYFWVYQDGTDRAHRVDQVLNTGAATFTWNADPGTVGTHRYYVTAVDSRYGESLMPNYVDG